MCNGCSTCEKVCPYGAITYSRQGVPPDPTAPRAHPPRRGRSIAAGLPGLRRLHGRPAPPAPWTSRASRTSQIMAEVDATMQDVNDESSPPSWPFCCNWCSYGRRRPGGHQPPELSRRCQDHPRALLLPREPHVQSCAPSSAGADGVILCGCHPGDCHYTTGQLLRPPPHDAAVLHAGLPGH